MANDVNVPEGVTLGHDGYAEDRGRVLKLSEDGKDLWEKHGEPDYFHFMLKVGSDSSFASRVVEELLAEKFGVEETAAPVEETPTNA